MFKISKKEFVAAINAIIEDAQQLENFSTSFNAVTDSFTPVFTLFRRTKASLIDILAINVNDPELGSKYGNTIEWWLYESPCKRMWIREKEEEYCITLDTPEKLYDYFVAHDENRLFEYAKECGTIWDEDATL